MRYYNSVTLEGMVAPGSIRSEIKGQGFTTLSFSLCTREKWYRGSDKACTHTEYHPVMLRDNSSWQMYSRYGSLVVPRAKLFIVGKLRHKSISCGSLRACITQIDCSFIRKAADNDEDFSRRYGRREWAEIPSAADAQDRLTEPELQPELLPADAKTAAQMEAFRGGDAPPKKFRYPWWGLTDDELLIFERKNIDPYEEVPEHEPGYFAPPGCKVPKHAA